MNINSKKEALSRGKILLVKGSELREQDLLVFQTKGKRDFNIFEIIFIHITEDGRSIYRQEEHMILEDLDDYEVFIPNEITTNDIMPIGEHLETISEPSRFFNRGDQVSIGNLSGCEIVDFYLDRKIYKVRMKGENPVYGRLVYSERVDYFVWRSIFSKDTSNSNKIVNQDYSKYLIQFSQRDMRGLFGFCYGAGGMNLNPLYQRELVWSDSDREKLLDSVFSSISIGHFVIRDYTATVDRRYEIIDGKQRLTTLKDFYEGRFTYKGKFYHELHPSDRNLLIGTNISVGSFYGDEKETKILFYRLNITGKVMDEKHLNKIKEMIDED